MSESELVLLALAWLGTYLVHSTLFLGGLALLERRRRPVASPRHRERLWRLALLGAFATATAQLSLGASGRFGTLALRAPAQPTDTARAAAADEPATARLRRAAEKIAPAQAQPAARAPRPAGPDAVPAPRPGLERATAAPATSARGAHATALAPRTGDASARGALRTAPPGARGRAPDAPGASGASGAGTAPRSAPESLGSAPPSPARRGMPAVRPSWRALGLGAFAALALAGLASVALSWARLGLGLRRRRPLVDGPLPGMLAELARTAGMRGRVRLSTSPRLTVPIALGIVRREICLPERALSELGPGQQRALLAHELAHVRRRDPAWFFALAVLERAFFFQPLNRVARRRLSDVAEILCDDDAVRWTGERLSLASCLTEVAHWLVGGTRPLPAPGMAGPDSRLGARVRRLLDDRSSPAREGARPWPLAAAGGVLALVAFAGPGLSLERAPRLALPPSPAGAAERRAPAQPRASAPASLPRAPRAEAAPPGTGAAGALIGAHALFEGELELLEAELESFRAELGALGESRADPRFARALDAIERRMRALRSRRERIRSLFSRVLPEPAPPPASESRPAQTVIDLPEESLPR